MQRIAILALAAFGLFAGDARAQGGPARSRLPAGQGPAPGLASGAASLPACIAGAADAWRLHQDDAGQADRRLVALSGESPVGFAALWSDMRYGLPSVFLRCFDVSGAPRGPERPVRERASSIPEQAASLTLGPGGQGAVAWTLGGGALRPGVFQVRAFGPGGVFERPAELVGLGPASEAEAEGEADVLLPSPLASADGRLRVAWIYGGRPRVQELGQGVRLLAPPMDSEGPVPAGTVRWVAQRAGAPIAIWNAGDEVLAAAQTPDSRPEPSGPGGLVAAVPDPRPDGGAWLLVLRDERLVLRHLDARARPDGDDVRVFENPPAHVDLASWSEGLALVSQQRGGPGEAGVEDGPFELRFLAADGSASPRAPIAVGEQAEMQAVEPRIAGAGESLLVAWSERRDSGLDVLGRLLRAGEAELGPERPLAEARATSHQSEPAASSVTDRRAIVVWLDERGGHPLPFGRLVSSAGDPLGEEFPVPVDAAGAAIDPGPTGEVAVVMGPAGDFLVSWLEPAGLACQAFEPDARPKGPPALVAGKLERGSGYAVVRQESHRSWLLAWMQGAGLFVRRVRGDGIPLAQPTAVAGASKAAAPALLELESGRVVVAWEEPAPAGARLELRLLHAELHASSEVVAVPVPPRGSHGGPRLARAPGGGFLLAWTAELSPTETMIAAREFDAEARPVGELLSLSEPAGREAGLSLAALGDGSWLVAFAIEGTSTARIAVRRLRPRQAKPGPLRLLDPPVQGYHLGSQQPAVVGVAGGWLGLWVDAHGGQGLDVWCRRAGLDFDREP